MSEVPSREELAEFLDEVHYVRNTAAEGDLPAVEASRKIVEHYNRGRMKGVDEVGYFIFEGVKVFEKGKRDEAEAKDALTSEQKVFGKK